MQFFQVQQNEKNQLVIKNRKKSIFEIFRMYIDFLISGKVLIPSRELYKDKLLIKICI